MRDFREKLEDIIEAIESIELYEKRGREAFDQDQLIQIWFVHFLQIIGEAVRTLPPDIQARAQSVPWSKWVGLRNILVHQYFRVDLDLVWDAVEKDLPLLKNEIQALLVGADDNNGKMEP